MGVHNFIEHVADESEIVRVAVPIAIFMVLLSTVFIPVHIAFQSYNE